MTTNSQELIRKIKEIKHEKKITYDAILQALPKENGVPVLSLTTIRRICANDSESRASSFNYEETLLPVLEALNTIIGDTEDSPQAKEIARLNLIIEGKDDLIARLIGRLDQKDEIIRQLLIDMRQKDEVIQCLMNKCL